MGSNYYYKHGMMTLMPDINDFNYSSAYVYNISNIYEDQFLGVYGLFASASYPFTEKLSGKAGIGTIFSAQSRKVNDSSYMATEINGQLAYHLAPKTTLALRTAYALTGGFYEVSDAEAAASAKGVSANTDPDNVLYSYLEFKVKF